MRPVIRLYMRFSMIWRLPFVHCVPVRTSPIAVHLQYDRGPHLVPGTRLPRSAKWCARQWSVSASPCCTPALHLCWLSLNPRSHRSVKRAESPRRCPRRQGSGVCSGCCSRCSRSTGGAAAATHQLAEHFSKGCLGDSATAPVAPGVRCRPWRPQHPASRHPARREGARSAPGRARPPP